MTQFCAAFVFITWLLHHVKVVAGGSCNVRHELQRCAAFDVWQPGLQREYTMWRKISLLGNCVGYLSYTS